QMDPPTPATFPSVDSPPMSPHRFVDAPSALHQERHLPGTAPRPSRTDPPHSEETTAATSIDRRQPAPFVPARPLPMRVRQDSSEGSAAVRTQIQPASAAQPSQQANRPHAISRKQVSVQITPDANLSPTPPVREPAAPSELLAARRPLVARRLDITHSTDT